jgi:dTDP-glucose 4,6-dehydratase
LKLLVTGGCGFIGSNFIRWLLGARPDTSVTNVDALTYAGNLENLQDVEHNPRYRFVKGSITDAALVDGLVAGADAIVNFAAESHVDRSLYAPVDFVRANIEGTLVLLEAARKHRTSRFLQVSTDEVYGSLPPEGFFTETTPLRPSSAYSASKAGGDLLALAYHHTHGLPVVISRSSNNYGPFQYPEKFVPLFISNALEDKPCPVYGDGLQVRDWLHVLDNCRGLWAALEKGRVAEVYNVGGGNERPNIEVAKLILAYVGKPESLLTTVKDRPGHDRRYALDTRKVRTELGWSPAVKFEDGLRETVEWYRANREWVRRVKTGEYQKYYEMHYGEGVRR